MDINLFILFTFLSLTQSKELSCYNIMKFVKGHNTRRMIIAEGTVYGQPASSNMGYVIWDDELAHKAAKWAAKHTKKYDPDTSVASGRFDVGQNIFVTEYEEYVKPNVSHCLDAWFQYHQYYTYGPLTESHFSERSKRTIGQYTQMVGGVIAYIGCGISRECKNDGRIIYYFVCNYAPSGNYIGQPPYESRGEPKGNLHCYAPANCHQQFGKECSGVYDL